MFTAEFAMLFKLAWRNILGAGLRSWINVLIIALVLIGMIWLQALYAGWMHSAISDSSNWEFGQGRYRVTNYDPYDPFSWDKSYASIPSQLNPAIEHGDAIPVLISAGVIYPQGRILSIVIKGIPAKQHVLQMPTAALADTTNGIAALIGMSMARSSHLKVGDTVTLRWRDAHGAFNADNARIAQIMDAPLSTIDAGQIWVDLNRLQSMKDLASNATMVIMKNPGEINLNNNKWQYESLDVLMQDIRNIMKTESIFEYLIFCLMLFLAMIAIFDTQVLAVFKRRKEIGTFSSLGMTKTQIIRMFTLEGVMYCLLAIVLGAVLGMPLFLYYGIKGYPMPKGVSDLGFAGAHDSLIFKYNPLMIMNTLIIVLLITTIVSWLPTLRIARMKPTDALRGKM
jgi:putative ABC transport system permease protein